jgi:sulfatase maturation enzyme AslB (radical SAM superfamily)
VKWLKESSDLVVLFNSASMPQNNPLLVLGPYGSLCWHGVVAGWPVRQIQFEAWRVFGTDEVVPFLARLQRLGFIAGDILLPEAASDGAVQKEFPAPEIQFQIVQSIVPWYCLWELSRVCDLRCKICYQPDFEERGLGPLETREVAQSLVDAGIFYVCLLGGEALLRPDLDEIVALLRANGVFTKIITNGQRLSRDRAASLGAAGLNLVEVSFDGLTVQTHDASRGEGAFARSVNALRNTHEAGIPRSGIVWTIHSGNLQNRPQRRNCSLAASSS